MSMELIVNNKHVEYYKFGNGKKVLVMIPGMSQKSCISLGSAVKTAYKLFCDDFTVYLIEKANDIKPDDTMECIVDDYIKVIEELNLKDIFLLGASYGGVVSQEISIKRPDLIKKMTIVSSTSAQDLSCTDIFRKWLKLTNENKLEELTVEMLESIYSPNIALMLKESSIKTALELSKEEIERFKMQLITLSGWSGYQNLSKISCPTLIVAAKGDKVFDYHDSLLMHQNIKDSKIYLYDEEKSHAIYDEELDFKKIVYDFFME